MELGEELSDTLVVSLEQAVAAPYCGLLLADAGARVIKVERPEGDFARGYDSGAVGESVIFAWLNRGKQSISLDLKTSTNRAFLYKILSKADVFLSNLAPGAIERMGFTGELLREKNPKLITCKISGYGDKGAAANKKAYDFIVQGESGICAVTGTEEFPSRVGVSLTDLSTGLTAFSAILRALLKRNRTGIGCDLSISMFDVMADWMNMPLLAHRYMGGAPGRTGLQHGFIAPYGAFTCKNGEQVLLSIQNDREWEDFCKIVLAKTELIDDHRFKTNTQRYKNRQILDGLVNESFAQYNFSEIIIRLNEAKIANGLLNSVADLSEHEFLTNSKARIGELEISLASLPVKSSLASPYKVPSLGEHNKLIKIEFE